MAARSEPFAMLRDAVLRTGLRMRVIEKSTTRPDGDCLSGSIQPARGWKGGGRADRAVKLFAPGFSIGPSGPSCQLVARRHRPVHAICKKSIPQGLQRVKLRISEQARRKFALRSGEFPASHGSIWVSPQIEIAWPEMVRPRGEHMNTIWSAICCGVTVVRIETTESASFSISSYEMPRASALFSNTRRIRFPSTMPGWIALTRMPSGPNSAASDLVKPTTAHFAAE